MIKIIMFMGMFLMSGCLATVGGNSRSVIIFSDGFFGRTDDAFTQANNHCAKYGREAEFQQQLPGYKFAFKCV